MEIQKKLIQLKVDKSKNGGIKERSIFLKYAKDAKKIMSAFTLNYLNILLKRLRLSGWLRHTLNIRTQKRWKQK